MTQDDLNPAQREAVRHLDGPCLVIAGAGSGKTRVITRKILHLAQSGIAPESIAAITFTNKAALEMAERLKPMLKPLAARSAPTVCTFHSLGVRILRADGAGVGLRRNFSILDADDAAQIIQQSIATTDRKLARSVLMRISLWKNALVEPAEAAAGARNDEEHRAARAFADYAATLTAYRAVDFDDLIRLPVALFDSDPQALARWRARLRYLLVDEYQDTNACQYQMLRQLVGPRAAFTAVGDDDQSIYGWRGATLENLQRLETDFPGLRVIKLEQNYRSSQAILTAANRLIAANPKLHEKKLFSNLGPGEPVRVQACDSDEHEAETVVMRLQAMKFEKRARFADFAILYRGNHQARVFEQALRRERIPYVISGGQSFFERAEIRDLIAYLRLLANDDDDPALLRAITTPRRGIGAATLSALGEYAGSRGIGMFAAMFESGLETRVQPRAAAELRAFGEFINRLGYRAPREPADRLLDELITAIDYRGHLFASHDDKVAAARWQNVCDFTDWLKKRATDDGADLVSLAQTIALLTQIDRKEDDGDAVRLSTVHASKGLEFAHVFVVGCEEGTMPHLGNADPEGQETEAGALAAQAQAASRTEEERRLMYVAITRAQRTLTLTWCKSRKRARNVLRPEPSRFIAEMRLQADPEPTATVTQEGARSRLGALKGMLVARSDASG